MKHFSDLCMRPAPNDLSPEPPRSNYSKHVFEGAQILAFLKSEPGYFPSLSSHKLLLLLLLLNLLTVNTKDLLLTNLLDSEALLHKRVNVFKKQNRFNYNFFPNQNPTLFQLSSVAQSCLTLCDPMNCSTPGLPVHHHLPEFTQTHVHRVRDAIQPSHPQSSPSPPAHNPSQHQSLFQ